MAPNLGRCSNCYNTTNITIFTMQTGRPTEYNEEIISKSIEYINLCVDEIVDYHKTRGEKHNSYERRINVKLPTIEGLASHLGVARSTLYEWKEKYNEFSDILEKLLSIQAEKLINNGLSGDYNSTIAKLLLAKHGYKDTRETDLTNKDNSIIGLNFIRFEDMSAKSN